MNRFFENHIIIETDRDITIEDENGKSIGRLRIKSYRVEGAIFGLLKCLLGKTIVITENGKQSRHGFNEKGRHWKK